MDLPENAQQRTVKPPGSRSPLMSKYHQSARRSSVLTGLEIPISLFIETDFRPKKYKKPIFMRRMSMQTIGKQFNRRNILQNRL